MRILCGDIGGTHSRLAVLQPEPGGGFAKRASVVLRSSEFASLGEAVEHFLEREGVACELASFGVPGPVVAGRCRVTNLPWEVDAADVGRRLGFERVALRNDLEIQAHGIAVLGEEDFHVLHPGAPRPGNAALIAAGTGLGQAGLFFDGERHLPFATEGGHTDLAPRNELEIALLRFLMGRHRRVSYERVVNGSGLVNLFEFLVEHRRTRPTAEVREQLSDPSLDPAAVISRAAQDESCALCVEALDLFVSLYGAEAGNLALKMMAVAGVYVGGGIAPKILGHLQRPAFRDAFCDKGRMRPLLEAIPLRVLLHGDTALYGAARVVLEDLT
ncbi:MAG: glucokinase [Acidobacteriota bacterium]